MKHTGGMIGGALLLAFVVFALSNRLSEVVRSAFAGDTPFDAIPEEWWNRLSSDPFTLSMDKPDLIAGGVVVALIGLIVLYQSTKRRNTRPGEEHGSARWAKPKEFAPFTDKDPARRLQLTATEGLSIDSHKTQRNNNVLVLGASGSGKTRHYVIPNLSRVDMSFAITDPKGELLRTTRSALEAKGYAVKCFNLVDLNDSDGFNPMQYFDENNPETSIAQMVEAIMTNTSSPQAQSAGNDKFFERAEKALLTALVAYVYGMGANGESKKPSLVDVSDLQKQMQAFEGKQAEQVSEVDAMFDAMRDVVAEWEAAGAGRDPIMETLSFACRQYRTFEQGAGETKKSIIISLGVRLAPLDMTSVRRILDHDTLGLDRLGFDKVALFLALPDSNGAFTFFASLFWSTLFEKNIYEADHTEKGRLPRQVHCFLDEFANIGKIPNFDRMIATIRSRGISASIIVQMYSQGKALYRDQWATIVGNCDSHLFLGSNEEETLRWLSTRLGEQTVKSTNTSQTKGSQGSWSEQGQILKRPLMTKDEIERMSDQEAILLVRGLYPFRSAKAPALQH